MFFTPVSPAGFRRQVYTTGTRPLAQFMEQAQESRSQHSAVLAQDEQSYTLTFDVPGISREQLVVGIEGNVVRPQDIDASHSEAKLEHGVLTLKLTKVVPASRVTELVIH